MSADQKLKELNLELPEAPAPVAVYKPLVIDGNIAYLSGHGPVKLDGSLIKGRVGEDLDQQAGYDAARQVGLTMLATLRKHLGSLDRVKRVIKLVGFVNSTDAFDQQPAVINGCSELFAQVFGRDAGIGARSALGANSLPGKIPVEIEGIFEITDRVSH
jgi:enamine deaminase RidA (YjgF/YER057c/UK114 family)